MNKNLNVDVPVHIHFMPQKNGKNRNYLLLLVLIGQMRRVEPFVQCQIVNGHCRKIFCHGE